MDFALLKTILEIPTVTGKEEGLVNFLNAYASGQGWSVYVDNGNVYTAKGDQSGMVPCFAAHTDTVHELDTIRVATIQMPHPKTQEMTDCFKAINAEGAPTGCGGDDKAGVFIAIEMMHRNKNAKAVFFRSEETGCHGSRLSDDKFFENVAYVIEYDSPENDRSTYTCSGVTLYSEEFSKLVRPILHESGINRHMHDPYTDVSILASKYDFNCLNLPAGYYQMHTEHEYVVLADVKQTILVSDKILDVLGNEKRIYIAEGRKTSFKPYSNDPYNTVQDIPSSAEDFLKTFIFERDGQSIEITYTFYTEDLEEPLLDIYDALVDGEEIFDDDFHELMEWIEAEKYEELKSLWLAEA